MFRTRTRIEKGRTRMPTPKSAPIAILPGVVLAAALLVVPASTELVDSPDLFQTVLCVADHTVGLHDKVEQETVVENFEPGVFSTSRFRLTENLTFRDLLESEDIDLYVSLHSDESTDIHEFTCERVQGFGERSGYSCVNNPPTEILTFDPESLRFSRASVGAWTLYTASDTGTSATLFVEKGTCTPEEAE